MFPRSKIIQGFSEDLRDLRSFKEFWKIFENKDPPKGFGRVSLYTVVDENSNVSVDNDVYTEFFDN